MKQDRHLHSADAPNGLAQFQAAFSADLRHLRAEQSAQAPARAAQIYQNLLFNNLRGFIDSCFPVARSVISTQKWQELEQVFYRSWRCNSPLFQNIPFEFHKFISARAEELEIPPYLPQLLHYEWLELEIDLQDHKISAPKVSYSEHSAIAINPTLYLARYQWPVHQISSDYQPESPNNCELLVYRDHTHKVRFTEINAKTAELVECIKLNSNSSIQSILETFATANVHMEHDTLVHFGQQLVVDLVAQNALIVAAGGEDSGVA